MTDAELITGSLAGSREAFSGIVARYQSLICSLAFSATGSLSKSEDVAQETFIAAWRQLRDLREPGLLRSWLCGIARNLANQSRPRRLMVPLDNALAEPAAGPQEQLISREEQAILWRSLEQIPEQYREPLVLFYREHQSVAAVAASLELSEEVVRQRLSRGRKLLHEQVLVFVEGALERSNPSRAFRLAVMSSIPSTAALGAATVKAGAAKAAGLSVLSLLVGPLTGAIATWFNVQAGLAVASSKAERRALLRRVAVIWAGTLPFVAGLWALVISRFFWDRHPAAFVAISSAGSLAWAGLLSLAVFRGTRQMRRLRAPVSFDKFEYKSKATLFGLPLVHIRLAPPAVDAGPARGIVAVGDRAIGVFALGEQAAGFFSVGAVSVGVIAVGGASFGLISLGGFALGAFAFAGAAMGFWASGGLALGWHAAVGGLAAARDLAAGGLALATHANDSVALAYFSSWRTLNIAALAFIVVVTLVPSVVLSQRTRRIASQE
ncbi:MAG TPA: sigma-70 family RNA polymerase sigma factor [Myxococcales bacterium]|nr:sigma-70 family RNA polymerase sigma factor [Myxococcales bacterium]